MQIHQCLWIHSNHTSSLFSPFPIRHLLCATASPCVGRALPPPPAVPCAAASPPVHRYRPSRAPLLPHPPTCHAGHAARAGAACPRPCACLGAPSFPARTAVDSRRQQSSPELATGAEEEDAHGEGAHVNVQHLVFTVSTFLISSFNILFVPFHYSHLKC